MITLYSTVKHDQYKTARFIVVEVKPGSVTLEALKPHSFRLENQSVSSLTLDE